MVRRCFTPIRVSLALLLLALVLVAGCGGCHITITPKDADPTAAPTAEQPTELPTETPTEIPTEEPSPVPTEPPVEDFVEPEKHAAKIKAVKTGTFGLASDGSLRFIGRATSGQNLIYGWDGLVDFAANDKYVAGLKEDGTVILCGTAEVFAEALSWTDIASVAMGDDFLVGLKTNGTVAVCGAAGAEDWIKVKKIDAAGEYVFALTENGFVSTVGEDFDALVNARTVVDIAAASDRVAALYSDGRVSSYYIDGSAVEYDWNGVVKVFASTGAAFGIDGAGRLYTDCALVTDAVTDACFVSASLKHAVVLHGDGRCTAYGENADMQCTVSGWRLLPYVDGDGWLLGMDPGDEIDGEAIRTGLLYTYVDPATGETTEATVVILGDVNGDGAISAEDQSLVMGHINGKEKLEGAYLRAANIIKDSKKPGSIDVNDLDALRMHLSGAGRIDQYAKTDGYTALLCEARRKNSDARGYIKIEGTNISYPIMYDRMWYYNDHDINRNKATRGSIYFYWGEPTGNIVITGHNSRSSGTMFHQLHKVQNNASKLKKYENRLWYLNVYGESGWWEVWAIYEEGRFQNAGLSSQYYNTCWPNGFDKLTDAEKQEWINYQLGKNELDYSVEVGINDRFMTLLTCGDSHQDAKYGARLYIFLRWVGSN